MRAINSFISQWVDGNISVQKDTFGFLLGWDYLGLIAPFFIPAMISLLAGESAAQLTSWLFAGAVMACIPWTAYILKRRKLKVENWVKPTRYSDETNGY